jgi:uncharacterized protein (DUF1800 family)
MATRHSKGWSKGSICSFGTMAATAVLLAVWSPAFSAQTPHHHGKAKAKPVAKAPVVSEDDRILHVLNRMGFGARPDDVDNVKREGLYNYIEQQLYPDRIDDSAVDQKLQTFPELSLSDEDIEARYKDFVTADFESAKLRQRLVKLEAAKEAAMPQPAVDMTQTAEMTQTAATTTAPVTAAAGATRANFQTKRDAIMDMVAADPMLSKEVDDTRKQLVDTSQPVGMLYQEFTAAKLIRATESQRQFQEVMVDFWNNHFNIDIRKAPCGVLKVLDDRDTIRPHVFGKFRDLLEASAKSPAMMVYLDNFTSVADTVAQPATPRRGGRITVGQNGFGPFTGGPGPNRPQTVLEPVVRATPRKAAKLGLNENYGREIMELHTLGVDGGYTQQDVREVARCFTGWSIASVDGKRPRINRYGEAGVFQFYPTVHDDGEKTVLGHVIPEGGGIQDGETVLDILASNPATMRHISYELCQRLVCDEPPMSLVHKCVETWKRTDGDLREIYRTIVTSPEFFSPIAMRHKIKSPFEYAISSVRALNGTVDPSMMVVKRQVAREANSLIRPPQGGGFLDVNTTTLLGEITTMGEPLFQYQAPTGFPEDSRKWVSSGALISRLNFSLALTSGKIKDVKLDYPSEDASMNMDPDAMIDRLSSQILHSDITLSTRATLISEAKAGAGANAATSMSPSTIAALLLGSPEFQRR